MVEKDKLKIIVRKIRRLIEIEKDKIGLLRSFYLQKAFEEFLEIIKEVEETK